MPHHAYVKGFQRGELARRTRCNLETIRYYEKIGLMPEPPRNASGYRLYDQGHAKRLGFILRGRQFGFEIEEIRGLLRLIDRGSHLCGSEHPHRSAFGQYSRQNC